MNDTLAMATAGVGICCVIAWCIWAGLNEFRAWRRRKHNRGILAQAVRDAFAVAADAWQDWDGSEVEV